MAERDNSAQIKPWGRGPIDLAVASYIGRLDISLPGGQWCPTTNLRKIWNVTHMCLKKETFPNSRGEITQGKFRSQFLNIF
jgi:hypothetical protein